MLCSDETKTVKENLDEQKEEQDVDANDHNMKIAFSISQHECL